MRSARCRGAHYKHELIERRVSRLGRQSRSGNRQTYPRTLPRFATPYQGLGELEYPLHDRTVMVTACGHICIGRRKVNLSRVFAGQKVGIREVSEKIWLASFMRYDLGFFDHETCRIESAQNPFAEKVFPCLRYKPSPM